MWHLQLDVRGSKVLNKTEKQYDSLSNKKKCLEERNLNFVI